MKKRGVSQVDWAISLGIFLIYLVWFFIFVRPQFVVEESPAQLLENAKENLLKQIEWEVEKRPLFVFSNITREKGGLIVDFPYSISSFAFSDNRYFTVDKRKLFFLSNLTKGMNLFWTVNSSKNYSLPSATEELTATKSYTTTKNFRADFDSGLLNKIYFNDESRLNDFELYINDVAIDRTNNSFVNSSILGGYNIYTDGVEHKCYILAENSKIYCFADIKKGPYDMTLKADLDGFSDYYSSNLYFGSISNSTGCESFTGRYIDFYNSNDGLSFIFDRDADIEFCYNGGLSFNATLSLDGNASYMILAHNGSYSKTLDYKLPYYVYNWGIKGGVKGVDKDKLNELNNKDYVDLKKELQLPIDKELAIIVSNSTEKIFEYKKAEPGLEDNVFVQSFDSWCLDKYSNKEKCKVSIRIW